MIKKTLKYTLIVLIWLGIWQGAAMIVGKELLLPSPLSVLARMGELCLTSRLYLTVGTSLLRVVTGLLLGVVLGIVGGVLSASCGLIKDLFSPLLAVVKSTPIASFIILLLLWLDRDSVPVVIATLIVLPVVWSNVETGISSTDKKLLEMAKAYKLSPAATVRKIYAPSLSPYLVASLRASLGMAWKAGIAAEALILPIVAVGTQIFEAKYNLETVDLFAWTVIVIILSVIIEKITVGLFKSALKNNSVDKEGAR